MMMTTTPGTSPKPARASGIGRGIAWTIGALVLLGIVYKLLLPLLVGAYVRPMVGVGYHQNGIECVTTPSGTCYFVFFAKGREVARAALSRGTRQLFDRAMRPDAYCVAAEPIDEPAACKRQTL